MTDQYIYMPIRELAELVRTGKVSPVELTEIFLTRLEKNGGKYHPGPTGAGAPQNAEVKFRDPDGVVFDISTHGWDGAKR